MLVMLCRGVRAAHSMASSSPAASRWWCALVAKSMSLKEAEAALCRSVEFSDPLWPLRTRLTSASLHISCLFDIQVQRQLGFTSENIVLLCLETSSALTPPSTRRAPRPSEGGIRLSDIRFPGPAVMRSWTTPSIKHPWHLNTEYNKVYSNSYLVRTEMFHLFKVTLRFVSVGIFVCVHARAPT